MESEIEISSFLASSSFEKSSFSHSLSIPLCLSRAFCSVYTRPLKWSTNFAMLLFSAEYTITFQIYFWEKASITISIHQFLANGFWGIFYAVKIHMTSSTTQILTAAWKRLSESEYYIWCTFLCAMQVHCVQCFRIWILHLLCATQLQTHQLWQRLQYLNITSDARQLQYNT